ncbi:hypothetical protein B0919_00220 [Hymenobacter sp. CRA2]|nr:hypothetical protein B0919_00220 [Hymenobacter sp. CRA2]
MYLLGGIAAAAVLALAYVYAVWYIPLIYVNFLATIGFGLVLGVVLSRLVKAGKLRNPRLAGGLGLLVGLMAEYIQWAVYLTLIINTTDVNEFGSGARQMSIASTSFSPDVFLTILAHPGGMFSVMSELAGTGSWSIFGIQVSGIFLVAVWLIEAAIIVAMPALSAHTAAQAPFSEQCGEWAQEEAMTRRAPMLTNADEAATALLGAELYPLPHNADPVFCRLKLYATPNDTNCRFASLEQVRIEVDNKGKESEKTSDLLSYLALSPEAYETLRERFSAPLPDMAEAVTAEEQELPQEGQSTEPSVAAQPQTA